MLLLRQRGRNSGRRRVMAYAIVGSLLVWGPACGLPSEPGRVRAWKALDAERWYSCGLAEDGKAFCWGGVPGYRDPLPLEDSLPPISAVPVQVPGEQTFVSLTVGESPACVLNSTGAAYCWGANQAGDVGDGSLLAKRGPSPVLGSHEWLSITAGSSHVCAITTGNRAYCWGNQFRGALGNGLVAFSPVPQPIPVETGLMFTTITAGTGFSCALSMNGEAYCWGINDNGRLGDGQPLELNVEKPNPSRVVGSQRYVALAAGGYHTCAIAEDGRAFCWGENFVGQLGNGSTNHNSTPTEVSGSHRWALLVTGSSHTCGITIDRNLYCWGGNERGQFGNGSVTGSVPVPLLIERATRFVSIVAGGFHTCGLTAAGKAYCWGRNDYGQLGNGQFVNSLEPTPVSAAK